MRSSRLSGYGITAEDGMGGTESYGGKGNSHQERAERGGFMQYDGNRSERWHVLDLD